MKKNILVFVLGMTIMGGIVFAAEALTSADNISYTSEYTDKTNVADVLSELLEMPVGNDDYDYLFLGWWYSSTPFVNSDYIKPVSFKKTSNPYYVVHKLEILQDTKSSLYIQYANSGSVKLKVFINNVLQSAISQSSSTDFYSLDLKQGDELRFEVPDCCSSVIYLFKADKTLNELYGNYETVTNT